MASACDILAFWASHAWYIGFEWYSDTLWHVQCPQWVKCLLDVLVSVIIYWQVYVTSWAFQKRCLRWCLRYHNCVLPVITLNN